MQLLHLVAALCCLATGFAVPVGNKIKWCTISSDEFGKCTSLAQRAPAFDCVKREDPTACIIAIKDGEADAITLNGEYIYKAGQNNYNLMPIISEHYGNDAGACSESVAVAKKGTTFTLNDLRGKKSCHSGLLTSEGWVLPISTLLSNGLINNWEGADNKPLSQVVSEFFGESCVPGASGALCQLCGGDCSTRSQYAGSEGALKCLEDDRADVAFLNPLEIPEHKRHNYELLCQDNSRKNWNEYKVCNLGKEPGHAVVTRAGDTELAENIWTNLTTVRANLFSSEGDAKNLLFSDSTIKLVQVPTGTDRFLYLGSSYMDKLQKLHGVQPQPPATSSIRWCAVGHLEQQKCDEWSLSSVQEGEQEGIPAIECQSSQTVEDCMKKIMRREADAMAVDGGQVYTAGKCGLVPAMAEQYDEGKCSSGNAGTSSYYAVAVIRKNSGVTWNTLRGKKSCHTGFGRTAGWNIPMGHIHKIIDSCDFSQFFSGGCAPGARDSSLHSLFCTACKGSGQDVGGEESKCKASSDEQYYGYAGAFRCLVEKAGDVAFIKHTIVGENTDGRGPEWARGLNRADFELICPGNGGPVAIDQYASCNLAQVPAHAVITRPDIRSEVVKVLNEQQGKFGSKISDFKMFESPHGPNLLFKDSTKCLQATQNDETYETFLRTEYMNAMESLRECTQSTPALEKSCTFRTCQ